MNSKFRYLKSDLANERFASKGHLGEDSQAIEPVLQAFESVNPNDSPKHISKTLKTQLELEIEGLKNQS